MTSRLQETLMACAQRLQDFQVDGLTVGVHQAHQALLGWIGNFEGLKISDNLLADLVDGIEFLSDDSIRRSTLDFVRRCQGDDRGWFTSFGEENESSTRIVSPMNAVENYGRDIFSLLDKLAAQERKRARIVFIDDFLNSGGQFCSIVNSWFSRKISNRRTLSEKRRALLKSCELVFVFAYGKEEGRVRAEKELEFLHLKGRVHVINQYEDDCGIFGGHDNIQKIEAGLNVQCDPKSCFRNRTCSNVAGLYGACLEAGRQLYQQYKPGTESAKVENRVLGYGNSAQLFVGQSNVPTCTLTCLWLGGDVTLEGKRISWEPLFKRKEKLVGGSESKRKLPCLEEKLASGFLDMIPDREPCFEIALLDVLSDVPKIQEHPGWSDCSKKFLERLLPELGTFLGVNEVTFMVCLDPDRYQRIRKRLFFCPGEGMEDLEASISEVVLVVLGGLKSFLRINLRFRGQAISHRTALETNAMMGLKQTRPNGCFFRLDMGRKGSIRFSPYQLFFGLASAVISHDRIEPSIIKDIAPCKKPGYFPQFSYFRDDGELYNGENMSRSEDFFKLAADFNLPREEWLAIPDTFQKIRLSYQASVGCSHRGCVFVGSNISKNLGMTTHLFYRYGICFLLGWHLELLNLEFRLGQYRGDDRMDHILMWIRRFYHFPFNRISELEYLNQYSSKINSIFSFERLGEIERIHSNEFIFSG